MESILLTKKLPGISLADALGKRASHQKEAGLHTLSLAELSTLLSPLSQKDGSAYRYYPSGGALYPIETYIIGSFEGNENTVCHYNPKAHSLEKLWSMSEKLELSDLFKLNDPSKKPQAAIVFTAVWDRSAKKYGDFAYNLALIEAGHMAQNVLLAATEPDIKVCPIGGFVDTFVHELLDLRNITEQAVYCAVIY